MEWQMPQIQVVSWFSFMQMMCPPKWGQAREATLALRHRLRTNKEGEGRPQ